jgi:hypothetical protein
MNRCNVIIIIIKQFKCLNDFILNTPLVKKPFHNIILCLFIQQIIPKVLFFSSCYSINIIKKINNDGSAIRLLKKILGLLGKTEPKTPTTVIENNNTLQDKEELLNRIKILEEKQQEMLNNQTSKPEIEEDYTLTDKQMEFALSLIDKMRDYELAVDPSRLTVKDLNRLVAYNRYNNKGAIVNLEKKGILKRKSKVRH